MRPAPAIRPRRGCRRCALLALVRRARRSVPAGGTRRWPAGSARPAGGRRLRLATAGTARPVDRPVLVRPGRPAPTRLPQAGASGASIAGCPLFPPDNPWRQVISAAPLNPRSAAWVASIGSGRFLHPDFGSDPSYGIPYSVVPAGQPKVPISFTDYGDESDPGPYPIPSGARIEAGGDAHVLVASGRLPPLRAVRGGPQRHRLDRRVRRGLRPALQRAAAGRLDLGRRRRPADPARTGPPGRGAGRAHRPRAAVHRRHHPARLHHPGHPPGRLHHRSERAADGRPVPVEGILRPEPLHRRGPGDPAVP